MNQEIKEKWVAALRSGKYTQGHASLCKDNKYCCLGVLCELAVEEGITTKLVNDNHIYYGKYKNNAYPPQEVCEWADFGKEKCNYDYIKNPEINGYRLDKYNDDLNKNFNEIADLIEAHL